MKVLFLADSMDRIQSRTDTTLYILREAFHRGMDCSWAHPSDLTWRTNELIVQTHLVLNSGDRDSLPQLGTTKSRKITDFDWVFVRKDPPFDSSYLRMCWLLATYEQRVRFSNAPSILIRHHEKMLPMEAYAQGFLSEEQVISSCVTDSVDEAIAFVESLNGDHLILKPWLGHGGRDIKLLDRESFLKDPRPHIENQERWILQSFEEDIFEGGDRRVLFVGGRYQGDFVRIPKSGHFVSNLVRGGQAVLREMNSKEKKLTEQIENFLRSLKIDFAGADYIASRLSEINITSPTGFASFQDLGGENLAKTYLDYLEREGA